MSATLRCQGALFVSVGFPPVRVCLQKTYDGEIDVAGVQFQVDLLVEGEFNLFVEILTAS